MTAEEKRVYDRAYRKANLVEIRAREKASRLKRGNAERLRHQLYRQLNPEKCLKRIRDWRNSNPGKARAYKRRICTELSDVYIRGLLNWNSAPPEIIELKRAQLLLRRARR